MDRLHACVSPPFVKSAHLSVHMQAFYTTISTKLSWFGYLGNKRYSQSRVFCKENSTSCLETHTPLTKTEEYQYYADVQDLVFLETKKTELERNIGRSPTYEEWADYVGCSIFKLYARVGKGRAAKRKMVNANLPLVSSLAKEFYGRGLSHQELFQEGAMGLMKSTEKFDISFDTKFSTYSYFWIRQRMLAAVYKLQNLMMVARSTKKTAAGIFQCKDEFREKHGRNPSMDELSALCKINKTKIKQTLATIRSSKALNSRRKDDNHLYNVGVDDMELDRSWKELLQNEVKVELGVVFRQLSSRESQIVKMRYGLYGDSPLSLTQIAAALDLSHEAVRMAEKKALKKLKTSADFIGLHNYLSYIEK